MITKNEWELRDLSRSELSKRGPEIAVVDIKDYGDWVNEAPRPQTNVTEIIGVEPRLSLYFTSDKQPPSTYDCVSSEILCQYSFKLPYKNKHVYLEGLSIIKDSKEILAENNDAIGVFLGENENIHINIYAEDIYGITCNTKGDSNFCNKIILDLLPVNSVQPYGVLLFNWQTVTWDDEMNQDDKSTVQEFMKRALEILKSRYLEKPGSFALWGCSSRALFTLGLNLDSNLATTWCTATISGRCTRSWSIPIDLRETLEANELILKSFKDKIRFKLRKSIALALISTTEKETLAERLNKTKIFSRVFGNLQLMIFGVDKEMTKFCVDSTAVLNKDNASITFDEHYVCYLIISYM